MLVNRLHITSFLRYLNQPTLRHTTEGSAIAATQPDPTSTASSSSSSSNQITRALAESKTAHADIPAGQLSRGEERLKFTLRPEEVRRKKLAAGHGAAASKWGAPLSKNTRSGYRGRPDRHRLAENGRTTDDSLLPAKCRRKSIRSPALPVTRTKTK